MGEEKLNLFGKPKYLLVFLKKMPSGEKERVKQRKFHMNDKYVTYRGKQYEIDVKKCSYSKENKHFLYMDIDTGYTYTYNEVSPSTDPESADALNAVGLAKAAMAAATGTNYGIIVLILCLAVGAAVGFLLGQNIGGIVNATKGG